MFLSSRNSFLCWLLGFIDLFGTILISILHRRIILIIDLEFLSFQSLCSHFKKQVWQPKPLLICRPSCLPGSNKEAQWDADTDIWYPYLSSAGQCLPNFSLIKVWGRPEPLGWMFDSVSHCGKWQTGQIKNPHAFDVCSLRSSRATLGCLWPAEFYWGENSIRSLPWVWIAHKTCTSWILLRCLRGAKWIMYSLEQSGTNCLGITLAKASIF